MEVRRRCTIQYPSTSTYSNCLTLLLRTPLSVATLADRTSSVGNNALQDLHVVFEKLNGPVMQT
jgi:hypothetical protein